MSTEIERLVKDLVIAWNSHNLDRLITFYADEYTGDDVALASPRTGPEGVRQTMSHYLTAFPDLHFTLDELITHDNRAALAWTAQGTHQGKVLNIPATGRPITARGATFLIFADCKIVKASHIWDVAGLLRCLGLLPEL